jgi:Fe-S-cluster-containing dehydrogenase component
MADTPTLRQAAPVRWAKVVDHTRCIGCHACSTACKSENRVPVGVFRTCVKLVDVGRFPQVLRAFQVTRCNQCDDPPCVDACPTGAMARRPDGIVDFDRHACTGCRACVAACPFGAVFVDPSDGTAGKCNFCAHRLDIGLEPACVVVCPTGAIFVGDLNDGTSRVAEAVGRDVVAVRRPQAETLPKLFYKGAHQATLDPIAARRPPGGIFVWSEQGRARGTVTSGHPVAPNYAMPAVVAYDVPRRAPWGARVSLGAWARSAAAGAWLVPALLVTGGALPRESPLWTRTAPLVAGGFLLATAALLVADLERPERVRVVLGRPQWRSWVARGALVLVAYGAALALHAFSGLLDAGPARRAAAAAALLLGLPLSTLAALHTAWLFGQARARELWQSQVRPLQILVHAILAGSASLVLVAGSTHPGDARLLAGVAAPATLLNLLLLASQAMMAPVTAHARLGALEMTKGRLGRVFWSSVALQAAGAVVLLVAPGAPGAALVLAGLLGLEHAFVRAEQSVPLA